MRSPFNVTGRFVEKPRATGMLVGGAWLRQPDFLNNMLTSIVPERGVLPANTSRNLAVYVEDWEGVDRLVPAHAVRFKGARVERNLFADSDFVNGTTYPQRFGGAATITQNANDLADPNGTFTATKSVATVGGSGLGQSVTLDAGRQYRLVAWLYVPVGQFGASMVIDNIAQYNFTETGVWRRVVTPIRTATGGASIVGFTSVAALGTFYVWKPLLYDVTGESNINPPEYIGTGGVPTPVADNFMWSPQISGNSAITADTAANSITGDLSIRAKVFSVDYTDSVSGQTIFSKRGGASGEYILRVVSNNLQFFWYNGAAIQGPYSSTVALSSVVENGRDITLRVDRVVGTSVTFYYSFDDGATWTQLGATVSAAGSLAATDTANPVYVGAESGTVALFRGGIYWAELRNSSDVVVARFDASRFTRNANGATMVASTGETWTLNSTDSTTMQGAHITSRAAFAFYGSGKEGLRYFPYANPNTVSGNVVTEGAPNASAVRWLKTGATSANYASTPYSSAMNIAGDIEFEWDGVITSIPTGTSPMLVGIYGGSSPTRKVGLFIGIGSLFRPSLLWLDSGAVAKSIQATADLPYPTGTRYRIKAQLDVDNGAAGHTVTFATSIDNGTTWQTLGTPVVTAGTTSIQSVITQPLTVSAGGSFGTQFMHNGRAFSALMRSGIGGTVVASFNANDFTAAGTTAVSSQTGETWTVNTSGAGNLAKIEEAFTDATLDGYYREHQVTYKQVNKDLATGWTTSGTQTITQNALAPDGTLTAYTVADTDAAVNARRERQITVANDATVRQIALRIGKDAVTNRFPGVELYYTGGTGIGFIVMLNTATGETAEVAGGTGTRSFRVVERANHWLLILTLANNTTGNTTMGTRWYPALGTVLGTPAAATTGSATFSWPQMVEGLNNALDPIQWIDASAGDVVRPGDILQYPRAPMYADGAGTMHDEIKPLSFSTTGRIISDKNAPDPALIQTNTTTSGVASWDGTSGAVGPAGTPTAGVRLAQTVAWGGGTKQVYANRIAGPSDVYDGAYGTSALLDVGSARLSTYELNTTIRKLRAWKAHRLSDQRISSIS